MFIEIKKKKEIIFFEKFWWFKNLHYLCSPFRSKKSVSNEKLETPNQ